MAKNLISTLITAEKVSFRSEIFRRKIDISYIQGQYLGSNKFNDVNDTTMCNSEK